LHVLILMAAVPVTHHHHRHWCEGQSHYPSHKARDWSLSVCCGRSSSKPSCPHRIVGHSHSQTLMSTHELLAFWVHMKVKNDASIIRTNSQYYPFSLAVDNLWRETVSSNSSGVYGKHPYEQDPWMAHQKRVSLVGLVFAEQDGSVWRSWLNRFRRNQLAHKIISIGTCIWTSRNWGLVIKREKSTMRTMLRASWCRKGR
jgi:hypothetical protein